MINLNKNKERLALAVIDYISENMSIIRRDKFDDWLNTVDNNGMKFSRKFSSERYDSGKYYFIDRTWYNNRAVGVNRFKYIELDDFRKELTRNASARLYVVPLNNTETVVFDSNPLPVETSVNDYLAEILNVNGSVAKVELSIYHNACDRNLTYKCTKVCFNLDAYLLVDTYNNTDYGKHESPHITKENYKYF